MISDFRFTGDFCTSPHVGMQDDQSAQTPDRKTNKQIYIFWNISTKTNHSELCGVAKKERPIGVGHSSHDFLIWYETQANARR